MRGIGTTGDEERLLRIRPGDISEEAVGNATGNGGGDTDVLHGA